MDKDIVSGLGFGNLTAEDQLPPPHRSLQMGQWVKLICGASYQDMPTVRRLVMLYALAGVDCIDVATDGAVVAAARQGLEDAVQLAGHLGHYSRLLPGLPWLMVSLNDSDDPHFRKAHFDAAHCPPACDRPCEPICPTAAIQFQALEAGGVASNLCYGCGRCMAVCPFGQIEARPYLASPETFPVDQLAQIDAIEIHTQTGHQAQFAQLWQRLQPWHPHLRLVSISCPDHPQVVPYLWDLYAMVAPLRVPIVWQTDGRPMSGDLGKGTTHATIRLAETVLKGGPPGYVQLAGGTNGYTVDKLNDLGLIHPPSSNLLDRDVQLMQLPREQASKVACQALPSAGRSPANRRIAGIAYGSYGRSQVLPLLDAIDQELQPWLGNGSPDQPATGQGIAFLPCHSPDLAVGFPWHRLEETALGQGIALAQQLVGQLKPHRLFLSTRYG